MVTDKIKQASSRGNAAAEQAEIFVHISIEAELYGIDLYKLQRVFDKVIKRSNKPKR